MSFRRTRSLIVVVVIFATGIAGVLYLFKSDQISIKGPSQESNDRSTATFDQKTPGQITVDVTEKGLRLLKVGTVGQRDFRREVRDVGVIDFNQDENAPVFPAYQGEISQPLVDLGDHVEKGQVLYTIDSPDLLQAESTLIQAAGVLELTTKNLARLRQAVKNGGGAQKDLDQSQSDQQTATGAYNSAKLALKIFGKTSSDADRIASSRAVDPLLAVKSPMSGTITARNAAPGMWVQPGTAPAPYTVADIDQMRIYDFVSENDVPAIHLGEEMIGHVSAYPDRSFAGKVTALAANVDPNTRRLQVESLIADPDHLLRPSMFADVVIRTGASVQSAAVPAAAVVRLGDGTMTAWTTNDDRRFTQRTVKIGQQQDGFDQILDGLKPGDRIIIEGTVFVSNIANSNASP